MLVNINTGYAITVNIADKEGLCNANNIVIMSISRHAVIKRNVFLVICLGPTYFVFFRLYVSRPWSHLSINKNNYFRNTQFLNVFIQNFGNSFDIKYPIL